MAEKGRLKIYFSYAQFSGKTRTMLKDALDAKRSGQSVVIGYLAPHAAGELPGAESLERLAPIFLAGQEEFDLNGALARKPDLILVDELAHANAPGSCHRRRYQDVEELLKAGIHVYTTVNVGNIESLQDTVCAITGNTAWDRIPDSVFDQADQVELIDIEPRELVDSSQAADSVTTIEQLTALREIALRRCADRVKRLSDALSERGFRTDEHVLACLSSAPSNARIIRTAARMARAFNSRFTALFVETPDFSVASPENRKRLQENRKLAEELGASIETVYGEDVPYQIAEFARLSGVTKIVLGRSAITRRHLPGKPTLTEQLLSYVPEMDVHIIPDKISERAYRPRKAKKYDKQGIVQNTVMSVGILCGATLCSILFYRLGFTDSNIIMVYILGVLLTSVATSHQLYSLISSVSSVFIFNYLFTEPRFSLTAYGTGYPVTFLVMFLTAYITGTFAIRYKEQASQTAKIAYRTKVLFDTDQLLSKVHGKNEIIRATGQQIMKLLNRNIVVFENEDGVLSAPHLFHPGGDDLQQFDMETELATARWVLANNHTAGATTDTMSGAQYLYLAIRINERVYGVVGIEARNAPLDASEHGILLSILGEAALALENDKNAREKEAAAILAESEQLRANLLRTISHDLRTPLTSISGNASNLLHNGDSFDEQSKQQIYSDIYDDSLWLINLVENLLYSTRIEDGRMTLNTAPELVSELIAAALQHIRQKSDSHPVTLCCPDELLLVKADARLVIQVILNLVDNAMKYTPAGTGITITAGKAGSMAEIQVADTGNGIPDAEKEKIFDKFYCGTRKIADNRRSLGLGLYLCKAIVEAHGGEIQVTDNQPHGAVFRFSLPLEEVVLHE